MEHITEILLKFIILAPPILMALTVHEAAHALLALWFGDPTAKLAGRISLNPMHHLDLTGTLVFFLTAWFGAGIGWAKPVPVDARNLKNPRQNHIFISAAGPVVNILFACLISVVFHLLIEAGFFRQGVLLFPGDDWIRFFFGEMLKVGVGINVILAFFNLIPLPPLDGSGILAGLLPLRAAQAYYRIRPYGLMILLALIFLPNWLPGFPDIIGGLILTPARWVAGILMPL